MKHSPTQSDHQQKNQLSSCSDNKENKINDCNLTINNFQQKNLSEQFEILNDGVDPSKIEEQIFDCNLTLFEKITHPKWQVRRQVFIQMSQIYQNNEIMDEFQPAWIKNIINDTNQFAMVEGLRFVMAFTKSSQMNYHILPYFIGNLLEKGSFQKQNVQELIIETILQCCRFPQETGFILSEALKKIEQKHPKVLTFCLSLIEKMLETHRSFWNRDQVRDCLEVIITLIQNTNKQIRQKGIHIFCFLYSMISMTFEQVKKQYLEKSLRQIQIKELEQLCQKIEKIQKFEIQQPISNIVIQIVDLHALLPEKFFEIPYYKQNERKCIAEQLWKNLENYEGEIDNSKDYSSIYSILISLLEESNYLIYSQGMRCIKELIKKLKNIPLPVSKHFFLLIIEKLKGSLSKALQRMVFNLLEDILLYENISCDQFLELMITQLESSKNIGLKVSCINWFKNSWLPLVLAVQTKSYTQSNVEILKKFASANSEKIEKSLLILYNKITQILKKENNVNLKKSLLDLKSAMHFDENNKLVNVIVEQIAIVNQSQVDFQQSRIIRKNTSVQSRYQTEEDLCEFAQISEEMQTKCRQSVEWQSTNLNTQQVEFMNKFMNDLIQLRKLSQNNQDQCIQSKVDEILTQFKKHYSQKDITGNDFLQQMTENIVLELVTFCKKVQVQKKNIAEKLYDFIIQLLIKMNKIQLTLDQEVLYQELKIALMQLNQLDLSKLISLLDSLYICNSLENMLKIGFRITTKYLQKQTNSNNKNFQAFINWLSQKINAAPSLDQTLAKLCIQQFETFVKMFPQTQLDFRQLLNQFNLRIFNQQHEQLDKCQETLNQSNKKSKSRSFGSRVSSYETPNKTNSKLEFCDSEEKDSQETLTQIQEQLNQECSNNVLDKFLHYLSKLRAQQLCNSSSHTVFLSPNSHSPGKHWRRGIGRENMIISTPNRIEGQSLEELTGMIEIICQHFTNEIQGQVFQIFYLFKNIYPNSQQCLLYLIFAYICPKTEYSEQLEQFLMSFSMDKSIMAYQYRQAFNVLVQTQEQVLIKMIHTAFNFMFQKIFENDLTNVFQYFVTTLTYMLTQNVFCQLANDLLSKYQLITNFNQIIETELINYKKLYDAFIEWQQRPQIDIQKLYQNNILIVDLQEIEECTSKRVDTLREDLQQKQILGHQVIQSQEFSIGKLQEQNTSQDNSQFIHINKADFDLLESTMKNFTSQQTQRTEEAQPDILNLQQFISPLYNESSASQHMHDPVILDLAKKLYSNENNIRLRELEMIKQQNESYRQHKRDSTKQEEQVQTKDPIKQKIEKIYADVKKENQSLNQNEKSLLCDALAPLEQVSKRNDCIKQLQELLLTSTSLYFDVASSLLQQYEILELAEDKLAFVNDLKISLINQTLLQNVNDQNFGVILSVVLKLCTTPSTQSEIYSSSFGYDDNELTKSLQQILDVLLHSKPVEQVLVCLIRQFNEQLPVEFSVELSKTDKMMFRLNLKCIERLIQGNKLQVFSILVEVLKFFKCHPAENLCEGLPSIKELELYFKQMKQITDNLLQNNPHQAFEFVQFVYRKNCKSIFLEYIKQAIEKLLENQQ